MTNKPKRTNWKSGILLASALTLAPFLSVLPARGESVPAVVPPFHQSIFFPIQSGKESSLPSATIAPVDPAFDFSGVPGWMQGKPYTNQMGVTIPKYEILVIKGSKIIGNDVVIPPGGVYFDASPARGELPMTGSADYFLGKKYYFVDYRPVILVRKDVSVDSTHWTGVGNHLYRLLAPPVPKVVPNPVLAWRTYDGVSLRPWAITQRWKHPADRWANQNAMTYLQGVIDVVHQKPASVFYASLTGTAISREWWTSRKPFFGETREGQTINTPDGSVTINTIRKTRKGGFVSLTIRTQDGKSRQFRLQALNSPALPESSAIRHRMIALSGSVAVVLWPKSPVGNRKATLWVYSGVEQWETNGPFGHLSHWNYFPIACPIAHHIGGMIYNQSPIRLHAGESVPLFGTYGRLKLVSVHGQTVQFKVGSHQGWTPILTKQGNIDSVFGEGRAVHGILNTLDATNLNLATGMQTAPPTGKDSR
ncbi:MAG: hypothetical protein ACYCYP_01370 [Leptospirales bacterium]